MINDSNNFMFLINASVFGSLKVLKTTEKSPPTFERPFTNQDTLTLPTVFNTIIPRSRRAIQQAPDLPENLLSASVSTISQETKPRPADDPAETSISHCTEIY